MPPFSGAGTGKRHIRRYARLMQACYQILRQERTIARYADEPFDCRRVLRRPVETSENAGKRSSEIRYAVGDDRQAGIGETRSIAVGIDDDAAALRREAGKHALQDAGAADFYARLVAAAHAPRQTAGKHETESGGCRHARSVVMHRGLAAVLGAFLLDKSEVLIEHDAVLAGERDEALAARAADQRQIRLARQFDAPGGKARARDQDRNAHAHRLDYHLGGEPAGGVENLVGGTDLVLEHPAGDLVDGVVAADVFHIDQRAILEPH